MELPSLDIAGSAAAIKITKNIRSPFVRALVVKTAGDGLWGSMVDPGRVCQLNLGVEGRL